MHFKNIQIFWWVRTIRWQISWSSSLKLMNRCEPPLIGKLESRRCRPEIRQSKTRASPTIVKLKMNSSDLVPNRPSGAPQLGDRDPQHQQLPMIQITVLNVAISIWPSLSNWVRQMSRKRSTNPVSTEDSSHSQWRGKQYITLKTENQDRDRARNLLAGIISISRSFEQPRRQLR